MSNLIVPVILSGGGGTRLWPLSTPDKPKQFLKLIDSDTTMIEATLARTANPAQFSAPFIVGSVHQRAVTEHHVAELKIEGARMIHEPCARNTAPAVALAALAAPRDAVLLILPSDHEIRDEAAFLAAVASGAEAARDGWLVTLGIKPTGPETGYGYIELAPDKAGSSDAVRVSRFVEKPSRDAAEAMLATGQFVWNAGIFLFTAKRYIEELGRQAPDMLAAVQAASAGASEEGSAIIPAGDLFAACPSDSIDYAVMERSDKVACVPVDMGWSDVGSWDALYELASTDESGNAVFGDAVVLDSANSLIRGEGITVATYGVKDLIIVATPQAVVILPRGESQKVKDLLAAVHQKQS